ncbi:MAG: hypothetical protein ACJ77K_10585 [Bacteroidia bacterium]
MIAVVLIVVFAGIIVFGIFFNEKAKIKRKLKKMPLRMISEVMTGEEAKISGTITYAGKTIVAPLSGRKCSYYHIQVEQKVRRGKSTHWETILNEEQEGDVVIRDGRNYAFIKATGSKSYVVEDGNFKSGFMNDASEHLNEFLTQRGIKSTNWLGMNKSIRYKEGVLEEGENVIVAGLMRWGNKSEKSLEIPSEKLLMVEAPPKGFVYFTDDSKLGGS